MAINVSGVIVQAVPEQIPQLTEQLNALPGVDVHGCNDNGKMVITIIDEGDKAVADLVCQIQTFAGVITANMVYHEYDNTTDSVQSKEPSEEIL